MIIYNKIGINYDKTRKADLRIFNKIYELLDYPITRKDKLVVRSCLIIFFFSFF